VKQVTQNKETTNDIDLQEENSVEIEEMNETDQNEQSYGDESETTQLLSEEELKIKDLNEQLEDVTNRLYRTQADYDNFRRRTREEREAAAKYRAQSLIEEVLPILDNFERALQVDADNDQVKSLHQGMEMVYRQLVSALNNEGVEEIKAEGSEFDPHLHQAIMQIESKDYKTNEIVEVLQKGYKLKDRVIRPALVKVNSN
jgi:molecular chaperone GrpE